MKGKNRFTNNEINQLKILIEQKVISSKYEQKKIRDKIRKIGFYFTDFSNEKGYTVNDLEDIEPKLKKHQLLVLKRETKNDYDDNAILILTEDGQKLGYVPQEKNEVLSNLMDAGKLLFGKLNDKTWVDNWLKLDVQVYLRDL